jgi:protein-disulfide isomerase
MTNARTSKTTREKAAALRVEAERQAARRRTVTAGIAVLAVIIVAVGATVLVRSLKKQQDDKVAAATAPPANLYTSTGGAAGVLYGQASSKVTVDMYEDFMCPACKAFESADSGVLRKYADAGKLKLVYHPVAILDDRSTTNYSTRAANAAATVLATTPAKFIAFHDSLYANQPAENSAGLPDATLIDLAVKAGVDQAQISAPITSGKYSGWVTKVTSDFGKKYNSTPTVLINGTQVPNLEPTALTAALDKAIAG